MAKIDPLPIAGVQARAARADAIAIIQKRRPGVRLALIAFLWLALGIAAGLLIR